MNPDDPTDEQPAHRADPTEPLDPTTRLPFGRRRRADPDRVDPELVDPDRVDQAEVVRFMAGGC